MRTRILAALLLTLTVAAMLIAPHALADDTDYMMNASVALIPCSGNLHDSPNFPDNISTAQVGQQLYINCAVGIGIKLTRYEVWINGDKAFDYRPSGFYRWHYEQFTPSEAGTYTFKIRVTTDGGQTAEGSTKVTVQGNGGSGSSVSSGKSTGKTYSYNGQTYDVVSGFRESFCYSQLNYDRFVNAAGRNTGCTATAMSIVASMKYGYAITPDTVQWTSGVGTSWELVKRVKAGGTYSQSEGLKTVYDQIYSDTPIIVGVQNSVDHVVACVGIRHGADRNNLKLSDVLMVDPWGGNVKTLNAYSGLDCGWGLRVPK